MFANQTDTILLSLPIGEHLNEQDLAQVVSAIKEYFV
jgi:5,10-methylene-tetrahydrofolate dehydrogenase/methenyl tetrahydrofolate cyclohydrolase